MGRLLFQRHIFELTPFRRVPLKVHPVMVHHPMLQKSGPAPLNYNTIKNNSLGELRRQKGGEGVNLKAKRGRTRPSANIAHHPNMREWILGTWPKGR